jgi:hypothetical protein
MNIPARYRNTIPAMVKFTMKRKEFNMKTNDLKKGAIVVLRNGWQARIEDNKKGNIRLATVFGHYTEIGSVYAHDIVRVITSPTTDERIEHTPAQIKLMKTVERMF